MNLTNADLLIQRASNNLQKWGPQGLKTLGLAVAEETGELAQAILQYEYEDGDLQRVYQEAIDLGALCLQVMEHFDGDHKP